MPVPVPRSDRITGSITKPIPPVKAQLRDLVLQAIHTLQNDATLPAELAPSAVTLAETEGLAAHGRSISIRLNR